MVQLYINDKVASITQPERQLKGFKSIEIGAGHSQTVEFTLHRADLAFVQANLHTEAEPGDFDVWIAPSSVGGVAAGFELLR